MSSCCGKRKKKQLKNNEYPGIPVCCLKGNYHKLKFELFNSMRKNQFIVTEFLCQQVGH